MCDPTEILCVIRIVSVDGAHTLADFLGLHHGELVLLEDGLNIDELLAHFLHFRSAKLFALLDSFIV